METLTTTPSWLSDNVPDLSMKSKEVIDMYPTTITTLELQESQMERMFHHVLHKLSSMTFDDAVASGPYEISSIALMRWIRKDKARYSQLEETQEAMAEINALNLVHVARAENSLEDAGRTKLRLDAMNTQSSFFNRKKFSKDPTVASLGGPAGPVTINLMALQAPPSVKPTPIVIDADDNS